MADPRIRNLKIKTGVVKRLAKEKTVYEKEADQQKDRIENLKGQGKDEYDIRKQEEVLQEALMMIPDCHRRLVTAYNELKNLLESEQDLKESVDYSVAKKLVDEVAVQLVEAADK